MSYTTNQECIAKITSATLATLHGGTYQAALLKASRASAAAIVDSYAAAQVLTPAYTLEDDGMAARLREVELNLVEWLEWNRLDTQEVPQKVKDRHEATIEWLRRIGTWESVLDSSRSTRGASVARRRGDLPQTQLRVLEFNAETSGALSQSMELGDSVDTGGQVMPADGQLILVGFRASAGLEGVTATIKPARNSLAFENTAGNLVWAAGAMRGRKRVDQSSLSFLENDRIGALITFDSAPAVGIDVKAWVIVELYDCR